MNIIYSRLALKDVKKVKDEKLKLALLELINDLKRAENLLDVNGIKKMSGHPDAYRIRIGDYRLGVYCSNNEVTIARFVKRNDIYKLFP
ncbi:type II toxin-antitoxin system RelE/ParE family toxin [Tenacibaculum sp. 47A_GOM-205m]|uniref:type II toxin-antitoxin system RelE family toxin n=1 Tax=Tenacibaculum sp. 47A_GOM-205m TaxID=1380384 RepID=UPI00048A51D7|nr:type II toxin-antitoxin system RelE/ParE family toxin [Tenacibaculum sp. 47A_GOM-205m]